MYENFSPRARRLLVALAQDEAYNSGCKEVEPEHIILALLKSADGLGYIVLQNLRINVLTMQLAIEQNFNSRYPDQELKTIPDSDRTSKFLKQCAFIAKAMGNDYIGTEHMVLAAVTEEHSLLWAYFKKAGISIDQIKKSISDIQRKIPSSAMNENSDDEGSNFINEKAVPFMADGSTQQKKKKTESLLEQFSRDLTEAAREGKLDPVVGRDKEVQRAVQILSRRTKNNPLLLGEPGVGKTAIVEGLAQRIEKGVVPVDLLSKRVLQLDLAAMVAGTKYRGEFEERLKRVMKEIKEAKNIILFIDELHTIIGAGGPEGGLDAGNMIKPALSRAELQIIGATTTKEYRKYFEKDSALVRRFQMIRVEEPSENETEEILLGLKSNYEDYHHVKYDDGVIPLIVKYSKRYINERFLPDKAIDILDEAGAAKKILEDTRPEDLERLEAEYAKLNEQKRDLVANQEYEKAAWIRDKVNGLRSEIDELNRKWKSADGNKNRIVTVNDVCKIISSMTGIDVSKLDDGKSARLLSMEKEIHKEVIGQDEAVNLISSAVRRNRAGVSSGRRPMGSFIFLGPTGVGKTQLAKTLAKFLFGTEDALIRVDMSDYMEKHNAARLVGAPPGYVGYEEGGALTEQVRQHPYSVVLLDEIEKAHHDIYNLLLQMLEEGELKDNLGHTVSFRNCLVIMTSNAGAREITADSRMGFSTVKEGLLPYEDIKASAMEELKRIMSPELLNRVDDVVVFNALSREEVSNILDIQLAELQGRLSEKNIVLDMKAKARDFLVDNGYEPSMGARPMRRLLQRQVEDPLSVLLLENPEVLDAENAKTVVLDFDGEKLSLKLKKSRSKPVKEKEFLSV
ncbi:ATP-dependent Clp protease ATP-binding subunit [Treponema sp.]|uniref:ATP-dependent Clp protease ATP-binding subunit n=1 Tax=Treponema sp. TaxID=166 RepID=UPI001DB1BC22|nr:ATP-dependent Clp protease ATP-binding subunit [Treponema sp.]MBS7241735.1 ATP-dependent Clp protease ATP-binding subunit [Treponema sp.]MDY4132284.1 ATP-dependent Clp protease ATP-binding subunit [Treponema sp.]